MNCVEKNQIGDLRLTTSAQESTVRAWLPSLVLGGGALYVLGELAGDVRVGDGFAFDRPAMEALHNLASPWLTATMRIVTTSASALVITGITLGVSTRWWQRGERRTEAIILVGTVAGSSMLGQVLKLLLARPRPHLFAWLTRAGGWSFPSGHTLTATVLGGVLAWLVGRRQRGWQRTALWGGTGLWALLVGVSRVYLGVHYPSDVLASLAFGGLCLLIAWHVCRAVAPWAAK